MFRVEGLEGLGVLGFGPGCLDLIQLVIDATLVQGLCDGPEFMHHPVALLHPLSARPQEQPLFWVAPLLVGLLDRVENGEWSFPRPVPVAILPALGNH